MIGPRALARSARQADGAVLVLVALLLPVLIGVGGLVVDAGNWFSHKRHLQVQADAGALAAAGKFRVPCTAAVDTAILSEVARYSSVVVSGSGYTPAPGYNPQTGGTSLDQLHSEINSPTFHEQSSPVDDTVEEGAPCPAHMIDVKLTETNLPWFLKVAQVPYINAHARVEIKQKTIGGAGALPVGVPEVGPKKVKAIFVNEATGAVIASTPLIRTGTSGGLALWSNAAAPIPVTVDAANIGVRIMLSGSDSTTCGDPLVNCYGAGTNAATVANAPGLVHIRGWSIEAAMPQVHDVDLVGGSCEDGYFTTTTASDPCTVDVAATIDFGATPPALETTRVLAMRAGANANTAVALAPPAAIGGVWTGGAVPVTAGAGAVNVELRRQTGCNVDRTKPCNSTKVSLGTVQRTFAGNESLAISGPIKLLKLSEAAVPGANSFQRCATCTHDLVVTLGLKPSLQNAQSVGDPIISLKVAGGGSQNQALDCDPDKPNLQSELATGCGPTYAVNDGQQACGGGSNSVWDTPQPWKCVVINTGAAVGQVTHGLNERILGAANATECTAPNNWADFGTAAGLPAGDRRIVQVFLTPFGAFTGSGGTSVPVTGFATFYVTGWDGGACQGEGDDDADQGSIMGHYIKYIDTLNNGGGGEEFCDYDSLGTCVAVITR